MKKYLVLKEIRPGQAKDLEIRAAEIDNETEDHFEGGLGSARTFFAFAKYYWHAFDTAEEAEAYRETAVTRHFDVIEEERDRRVDEVTDILKAHKQ